MDKIAGSVSDWLTFESRPTSAKINSAYRRVCSSDSTELDDLFGEVADLNETLDRLKDTGFAERSVDEKWTIIFKNNNFIHLRKLVSILLSIFPSNAYCESVFSIVKNTKTDERNRMKPKLLNSLVSIKCNANFNCTQANDIFLSNPALLNDVKSAKKYKK